MSTRDTTTRTHTHTHTSRLGIVEESWAPQRNVFAKRKAYDWFIRG